MGLLVRFATILVASTVTVIVSVVGAQSQQVGMYDSVPRLIQAAGYPVEKHRVTTEDGYVLQMHRIPAGRRSARRSNSGGKGKKAILVVHGLLGSSGDFILMGPNRSLGYMLADAGYDVWLGNLRGTQYSTHKDRPKNEAKFWEFSFHEHGGLDVPAMIDKVLNVTGLPRITYVGYSMGTTSFFTMMSQKPEYNEKIIDFVALAPAVYMDNMKGLATLALDTLNIANRMRSEGINYLGLNRNTIDWVVNGMCNVKRQENDVCMGMVYSIVGEDYEQNDWDLMPTILARMQPASFGQLEHFAKIALSGVFTTFEGGLKGPIVPYNLTNVRVPVTLLYGENDLLTQKNNIMRLAYQLNETGVLEDVKPACTWPKFNHLDFVFAKDVGKMLNKPLVGHITSMCNKYDPS